MKPGNWETVSNERNFANAHLEVVTVEGRTPSRSEPRTWTIVHRKSAVVVAAITVDGKIFLIRQERMPIVEVICEMFYGQVDDDNDDHGEVRKVGLGVRREEARVELV